MDTQVIVEEIAEVRPHIGRPGMFALRVGLCSGSRQDLEEVLELVRAVVDQRRREMWRRTPHKYDSPEADHPVADAIAIRRIPRPCRKCTQFSDAEVHHAKS